MATISASAPSRNSPIGPLAIPAANPADGGNPESRIGRLLLARFAAFAGSRRLAFAAGLVVAGAALESVGILLIVPLLQLLLAPGPADASTAGTGLERLLEPVSATAQPALLLAAFGGLMLLRAGVLVARDTVLARLQWGFIEAIKLGLLRRLSSASWKEVMALNRPRLNRALGSDMVQVGVAVNATLQTAAAALMLAAYCSFALAIAPRLALLTFGILAVVAFAGTIFVRRAGAFGRAALGYDLRMEESASHFLTGLKLAKAQDLEAGFVARYATASRAGVDTRVAFVRAVSASRQLSMLFGAAAASTAVLTAVLATRTEPALLVAFVVLLVRTGAPVAQVQHGLQHFANALPIFADLDDLGSQLPAGICGAPCRMAAPPRSGAGSRISLRAASLVHRSADGEPRGGVLAADLDIAPGEFVGLSGPTGSGKSTLLDLVAGLEPPEAGTFLLDGAEPSEARLAAHRRGLGYLAADPVLFGGTVRSNLAWAAPDADDRAMWDALAVAGATELIDRLGGGLDSPIHEAGANLSAGERQQLALARALTRGPALLLLDEATSSLDRARERRVLARLTALKPRPTILLVSHRAESFAQCDRVVAMSGGHISSTRRLA
jgi:ABC-type multidrug transport system fused ATPase/permease subunit